MTESDRAFPIRPRFWYSSTMETRFFLTYQLSQRMITWFLPLNSGITWRIMDTASSSFDSFFATYGIRAGQTGNEPCFYPISRRRALCLRNNAHSGSWNRYVPHGQKVWRHPQIFCRTLGVINTKKNRL